MYQTFRAAIRSLVMVVATVLWVGGFGGEAQAQFGFNFGNNIGGVRVNVDGVLSMAPERLDPAVEQKLMAEVAANNQLFTDHKGLRKLSLSRLNAAVEAAARDNQPLPAAARYLGGLVRIEYVYVDRDRNDLILAGTGDELVADGQGNVVGKRTGLPAIHLEDLMTALRTVDAATTGAGISVSIEPSDESRVAFRQVTAQAERLNQVNAGLVRRLEESMGPQNVLLTGVPKDSRFANVLALADYRMKRISMGLDPSPLESLPSFVSMLTKSTSLKSMTPRFWMEMNYQPVQRSENGQLWKLSGTGVKTLTENDFVNNQGGAKATGQRDPIAAKWADRMTETFGDLINKDQIFAELRNVFDLSVIAALIEKEGLLAEAGVEVSTLVGTGQPVVMPKWNSPSQVPTAASLVNYRRGTIITASGGVQLDPWSVVSSVEVSSDLTVVAAEFESADANALAWN